ncbi:glyoxylase-like metal-dependent hydrolase (beta-lactamase superfamily II) [Lysobacter niastensis]|uniref:Glyoxylase-like metal-dependent hydrolase (Beta-lactamase superfamily II) n=1 Tax=Lysobacter niastensis TaxID=380629 RepID=A0ABU1W765_9GAMM|nr:MBL fold metallo-hydrolase [Lysobacter niastensis]MDR7133327.1 glyoxylase-like metal-dependent hydrolase (beta-lactamase superfamily II) [Lysobacter niastensis]
MRVLAMAAMAAVCVAACAAAPKPSAEQVRAAGGVPIAPGIALFRGDFVPGRQPDGNSIVLQAPDGLIVFDTGRHREHTQRLLDHARASGEGIAAIINSHWHLDHSSGNRMLRRAYPDVEVLASDAVNGALTGFLADSRRQAQAMIDRGAIAEPQLSDVRGDMETIAEHDSLIPTRVVEHGEEREIAGRRMRIGFSANAATAGDVWLFDPATKVLLAGDLVTLPAPFLDTACPAGWRDALAALDAIDFKILVPGHGAPMDRAGFGQYRVAFDHLLACANGNDEAALCIDGWLRDAGTLVPASQQEQARRLLDYYVVQVLRAPPERRGRYCKAAA